MPVGRFAKLAFVVPAAILLVGAYEIVTPTSCPAFPRAGNEPCGGNATEPAPCPAAGEMAPWSCVHTYYGGGMLGVGLVVLPFTYLFYRSRFYNPLPS